MCHRSSDVTGFITMVRGPNTCRGSWSMFEFLAQLHRRSMVTLHRSSITMFAFKLTKCDECRAAGYLSMSSAER